MASSEEQASKRQRTHPAYTLLYHAGIPGRGEPIRLAFEVAGVPYTDAANESEAGKKEVYSHMSGTGDEDGNPPPQFPPMLKVPGAGKNGKTLLIFQSPTILAYLGKQLGLDGEDEVDALYVNELALTAMDLQNEVHETHHPIASEDYYEDQKEEAVKRSAKFRANRLPKFLGYFERVLKGNEKNGGEGKFLVGSKVTYADTTLWQLLNGLMYAFPKEMEARKGDNPTVFSTFYPALEEELQDYLSSNRRLKYSMGIYRQYPELDRQE